MKYEKYITALMKLCLSAVILGEATVLFMLEGWKAGKLASCGAYISELPEICLSVTAAATITLAGILALYITVKTYCK